MSIIYVKQYIKPNTKDRFDGISNNYPLSIYYDVEKMLRFMKCSSPGLDGIPSWFFRNCSYEIADVVTHILNLPFTHGVVPQQWRCELFV